MSGPPLIVGVDTDTVTQPYSEKRVFMTESVMKDILVSMNMYSEAHWLWHFAVDFNCVVSKGIFDILDLTGVFLIFLNFVEVFLILSQSFTAFKF